MSQKLARTFLKGAFAGAIAIALMGSEIGPARSADTVKVGMPIPVTITDNGFHAFGEELGIFEEENINLDIVVFEGSGKMVPQVATKNIDTGWANPGSIYTSAQPGRDPLNTVYWFNTQPEWPIFTAVLADSPIKTYADLKGKKVGTGALTWGTIPILKAALISAGLEPGTDVDIVGVGVLGSGWVALKEGRVDALDYNYTWHQMLEFTGTKIRLLEHPPTFRKLFSNGFMSHRDVLAEKKDQLTRFGRAMTKSLIACQENPEECARAFWRRYPNMKPQGDEAKALKEAVIMLEDRIKMMHIQPKEAVGQIGYWPRESFELYREIYFSSGWTETRDIDIDSMFTNDLVPGINDFDEAEVRALARTAN